MRPHVTLKLATSLDGRIATATGESKWITGPEAREMGHRLRAESDAILVGVETVLTDDPELTHRLLPVREAEGEVDRAHGARDGGAVSARAVESPSTASRSPSPSASQTGRRQPLRVVLDSRLRTPATAKVASGNTLILTTAEPHSIGDAEAVRVAADRDGRPAIPAVLEALAERGVRTLIVEGGGRVAAAFVAAGAVDALWWFRAPILLGADGRPCVAGLALAKLADAPKFRRLDVQSVGEDLWERYEAVR
ncbi:bifunctional diaminohydroxyphosphoribosylaminopyrimidine deaminase/5-amino-6-(5-phosphoribosylamino)uracil reductase RibD [Brevundimonas sp.]|jgi:diaminohydroxyphosphoribosylaminopyrimidine deaminase/5-amino-6-(5-phosphoribosylamino)uracil reductase|uniref:bifunctional diaminohydroxyphosphoribosylaminopyrimidine deaminase/5-amino-6-(5-phosphoribosylamino)uracil reductase RibD n=1 Tax=Brevundimonas sp. TaxID=1871086 RepID=UPI002E14C4B8|nr:bifunctional diaminohydroxyphosphoribosylaminopyrimidine deaminase/5-amino-6-(5-phosphoribosylamino)uracil reductase RibD [Brevundimonas sp.]